MFIKISNDVIINADEISSIERQTITSDEYEKWQENYNITMNNVIKEYLIQHPEELEKTSENELVDSLIKRFSKYVENTLGGRPDAFIYSYYIILRNNMSYDIDEITYNNICQILDIKLINTIFSEEHDI